MKIALVTHTFFPKNVGGRERHVYDLAKILSKKHKVEVFTCSDSLFASYIKVENPNLVIRYLPTVRIPMPTGYYRIPLTMLFTLLNSDYDIIHAHEYFHFTTYISAIVSKINKKPFIFTEHGYPAQVGVSQILIKLFDRIALPRIVSSSKRIIAVSNFIKEEILNKFKISEDKVAVVYNGIFLDSFKNENSSFREVYNLKNKKIILAVGRLIKEKGFQYLIQALPEIIKKIPEASVVIVGPDNYYKRELIRLSKKLNVQNSVIITGPLTEEMLRNALFSSDIIVIPSTYEPFGIIALEAMIHEKPIVASDVGGLSEILKSNRNCLLVSPGDAKAIANNVIELLTKKPLAKRISKNAKKDVKKYNWRKIIPDILKIYEDCKHEII